MLELVLYSVLRAWCYKYVILQLSRIFWRVVHFILPRLKIEMHLRTAALIARVNKISCHISASKFRLYVLCESKDPVLKFRKIIQKFVYLIHLKKKFLYSKCLISSVSPLNLNLSLYMQTCIYHLKLNLYWCPYLLFLIQW
jgi:hypothetical protein